MSERFEPSEASKPHQTRASLSGLPLITQTLCSQSLKLHSRRQKPIFASIKTWLTLENAFLGSISTRASPGSSPWLWCSKFNRHWLRLTGVNAGSHKGYIDVAQYDTHTIKNLLCQNRIWGLSFHQSFWRRSRLAPQPKTTISSKL